jgi:tetratricopeptide (TPR) repeat protein
MSLINEMLHDLEKRRKQQTEHTPVVDRIMPATTGITKATVIALALSVLLLAGVVWGGFFLLSTMSAEKTPAVKSFPEQGISIAPTEKQPSITVSPLTENEGNYSAPAHPVLPEMTLNQEDGSARLMLNFTRPPQYSLVQSGGDNFPLIIKFTGTTMGEHLEIPEVTGSVLERIQFQPRQGDLQLLVDLATGTAMAGFELFENSEADYSLIIDFVQQLETLRPTEEKQPYPLSLEKISDLAQGHENQAVPIVPPPSPQEIVLTKKERLPSPDKQSHQTGLEQLRRGEFEAAARSFSSALAINPAHTRARLQLIATLQQLHQSEQAAQLMRQGLELLPENKELRKEYARYLLNNRQIDKAVELLRQSPVPAVPNDLEYHALLAALLQESGQYSDAAKVYIRLLQIDPTPGIWWLGLAIAMDQTGNSEQAREAYRKALNRPRMEKNTRVYIESRLEVLSEGVADGW